MLYGPQKVEWPALPLGLCTLDCSLADAAVLRSHSSTYQTYLTYALRTITNAIFNPLRPLINSKEINKSNERSRDKNKYSKSFVSSRVSAYLSDHFFWSLCSVMAMNMGIRVIITFTTG